MNQRGLHGLFLEIKVKQIKYLKKSFSERGVELPQTVLKKAPEGQISCPIASGEGVFRVGLQGFEGYFFLQGDGIKNSII
jgi:hypothetical protein